MENAWVLSQDLAWASDWNGDEVGYPEYDVVGLYMLANSEYGFYIEMESMRILEVVNFGGNLMRETLAEYNDDMLFADGFDEALMGVGSRADGLNIALYNTEKVLQILMADGMTREEAEEYFEFNILGSFVGENTPMFVTTPQES